MARLLPYITTIGIKCGGPADGDGLPGQSRYTVVVRPIAQNDLTLRVKDQTLFGALEKARVEVLVVRG